MQSTLSQVNLNHRKLAQDLTFGDLYRLVTRRRSQLICLFLVLFVSISGALAYYRGFRTEYRFSVAGIPPENSSLIPTLQETLREPATVDALGEVTAFAVVGRDRTVEVTTSHFGVGDIKRAQNLVEMELLGAVADRVKTGSSRSSERLYRLKLQQLKGTLSKLELHRGQIKSKLESISKFRAKNSADFPEGSRIDGSTVKVGEFGYLTELTLVPIGAQSALFSLALAETDDIMVQLRRKIEMLTALIEKKSTTGAADVDLRDFRQELFLAGTEVIEVSRFEASPPHASKMGLIVVFSAFASILLATCVVVLMQLLVELRVRFQSQESA